MDKRQELKGHIKTMMHLNEKASVILGAVINVNLLIANREKSAIVYGILEEIRLEEMKDNVKGISLADKTRFNLIANQVTSDETCTETIKEFEYISWAVRKGRTADEHDPVQKTVDKDDHFVPENLGRILMLDPKWEEPEEEEKEEVFETELDQGY